MSIITFSFTYSASAPPATLEGWELVFEDNFDGTDLDNQKWNSTYNWGNTHNHRAYCVAENVTVSEGLLRIKGETKRHPDAPQTTTSGGKTHSLDYTSGAIDTKNKFSLHYGYIEGRFKMPPQRGTWPAFWMLQDGWPPEIDILEVPHNRNQHHYYLHFTQPDWFDQHGDAWDREASFGGVHTGPDKSAGFHNYGVEWSAGNLSFYFDDERIASYNRPREISQTEAMYIIVNLAIGGWATDGGDPIEITAENPAWFECDWVRAYSRKSTLPETIRLLSVSSGFCMIPDGNSIVLGSCQDERSLIRLEALGSNSYRVNFGDQVLEIPNEVTDAGVAAGLWGWNGKNHQRAVFEPQSGFESTVVRIRMQHSGHYLRADEERVIQDWNTSWPWNQNWKIVFSDSDLPGSTAARKTALQRRSVRIINTGNLLSIIPVEGVQENDRTEICIVDTKGKTVLRSNADGTKKLRTEKWPRGTYLLKLSGENGIHSSRIVLK